MKSWLLIIALFAALYGFITQGLELLPSRGHSYHPAPGVLAADMPVQINLADAPIIDFKGYRITPLATFDMQARALSKERYRWSREADLSSYDIVFGWGPMSDSAVLDQLKIRQSNRWYSWRTKGTQLPVPQPLISASSANMHLIAATDAVLDSIKAVNVDQVVQLSGYLVRVDANDGWKWSSSLSRNDVGSGACELIFVQSLRVL